MLQAVRNAIRVPDVRNKLLFTFFILVVYQFATHIPVVGVDETALRSVLESQVAGGFVGVLNLLSGGAVSNFSILANGVYPYITASIIFNLLTPVIPGLEALQREPGGQEKLQRYTYYLTIPMAVLQSIGQIAIFSGLGGAAIIPGFGTDVLLTISVVLTMVAGTMFAVWLGELITEQGIGNGISIIIFAGIVATAPLNLANLLQSNPERLGYNLIIFLLIVIISVFAIIYIQEGVRRIPVQYGKRVRGNKQYQMGRGQYIPLKVNPVGMIPLIFAQAIIVFPAVIVSLFNPQPGQLGYEIQQAFGNQQGLLYWGTFFLMTVAFTFFYADVMVGQYRLAETLQRQGGFIPGIRPGKRTEDYIIRTTRRITFVGALFLGIIAVVPGIVDFINQLIFPLEATTTSNNPAMVLSGAGLIIVVGVVIDTLRQLEAQLVMRNYEGFMR
ncbi:preprotein translocase subunit SecY [Phototrophicus methaneseepsis]|uniref:Protein translocase subunit SecY n=1 Tax=Phototrophicus methaneseepsis TaxID=2710758 RepID=A0A7S8ED77_9CHLR|nr:preprotein translocase subunit SecY [Phototrophicus methaneseepsis]QPC84817.1 preprotein translocase subunit SecY [Phototrophicus methaneseepsis]